MICKEIRRVAISPNARANITKRPTSLIGERDLKRFRGAGRLGAVRTVARPVVD